MKYVCDGGHLDILTLFYIVLWGCIPGILYTMLEKLCCVERNSSGTLCNIKGVQFLTSQVIVLLIIFLEQAQWRNMP